MPPDPHASTNPETAGMDPAAPTPEDLRAALAAALAAIARLLPPGERADAATDRATDAILRAAALYDAAAGPFGPFARIYWLRAVGWAAADTGVRPGRRPPMLPLTAEPAAPPAAGPGVEFLADVDRLPADLRPVVLLHCVHGYTLDETGLLCGLGSRAAALKRLRRAAAAFAGGPAG